MRFEVTNTKVLLLAEDIDDEENVIEFKEETAYTPEGAQFDERYLLGMWDGKKRLVKKSRRRRGIYSCWAAPVGLLPRIYDWWGADIDVTDKRGAVGDSRAITLVPEVIPSLRDYQTEAVDAALASRGLATGKGLLRLPTRSGKTVIGAGLICRLGLRTVFIVQSTMLLEQTLRLYRRCLAWGDDEDHEEPLVAQFGNGKTEVGWVTVASVQALAVHSKPDAAKRDLVKGLLKAADLVIFDECHHLKGESWRRILTAADARYKIGLSATINLDQGEFGVSEDAICVTSSTGPILYSLMPSDLIRMGWLCRPVITFVSAPDVEGYDHFSFAEQYKGTISENEKRNFIIADLCVRHVLEGETVLVTVSRLGHVEGIKAALCAKGIEPGVIVGKTTTNKRAKVCAAFKERGSGVLIGTVFGEGVDLPYLDVVIVADAMSSRVLTMQRLRNLTPYDKVTMNARLTPMEVADEVVVYDLVDSSTKTMVKHTRARLREYRKHTAFKFRWDK